MARLVTRDTVVLITLAPRVLGVVLLLSIVACQPGSVAVSASATVSISTPRPLPAASWTPLDAAEAVATARHVTFGASDGIELDGRLFGTGDVTVVLSHMGDPTNNQSDWYAFAAVLAEHGYRALTYDSRGICPGGIGGCSKGSISDPLRRNDVLGAVQFARAEGAQRVVLVGASLGATASLQAVIEPANGVDGLIWLAGSMSSSWSGVSFSREQIGAIAIPVLVLVADHDPVGVVVDSQRLYDQLSGERRLVMPSSQLHGTDMLRPGIDPTAGGQLLEAVLEYLTQFRASP